MRGWMDKSVRGCSIQVPPTINNNTLHVVIQSHLRHLTACHKTGQVCVHSKYVTGILRIGMNTYVSHIKNR